MHLNAEVILPFELKRNDIRSLNCPRRRREEFRVRTLASHKGSDTKRASLEVIIKISQRMNNYRLSTFKRRGERLN